MVDIIIAFAAATSVPVYLLLIQGQQVNPIFGSGVAGALASAVSGGLPVGIVCLLAAQALAVLLALNGVWIYYIHWVFRKRYTTSKDAEKALDETVFLPLSPFMQRKLRRGIKLQFMRGVWARRDARMKRERRT